MAARGTPKATEANVAFLKALLIQLQSRRAFASLNGAMKRHRPHVSQIERQSDNFGRNDKDYYLRRAEYLRDDHCRALVNSQRCQLHDHIFAAELQQAPDAGPFHR